MENKTTSVHTKSGAIYYYRVVNGKKKRIPKPPTTAAPAEETKTETKKEKGYVLLFAPTLGREEQLLETATPEETSRWKWKVLIEKHWAQYGYDSFNQTNLTKLVALPRDDCFVIIELLAQLVRFERTMATELLNGTYTSKGTGGAAKRQMDEAIGKCETIAPDTLRVLLSDLYRRDAHTLYFDAEKKKKKEGKNMGLDEVTKRKCDALTLTPTEQGYESNQTAIICLDERERYAGHIYIWRSLKFRDTAEVIGIRSSLLNLMCRTFRDVALKIFWGVVLWCEEQRLPYIVVQPLKAMVNTLMNKLKFQMVEVGGRVIPRVFGSTSIVRQQLTDLKIPAPDQIRNRCQYPSNVLFLLEQGLKKTMAWEMEPTTENIVDVTDFLEFTSSRFPCSSTLSPSHEEFLTWKAKRDHNPGTEPLDLPKQAFSPPS